MILRFALLLAALLSPLAAHAAPRTYAVLSMVGDALTVVTYQPTVGHAIDRNLHEVVTLADPVLDRDVLRTVNDAILASDSAAAPVLLGLPTSSVPKNQVDLFDGNRFQPAAPLVTALKSSGASHLVLVTKYRSEARLQMLEAKVGSGMLEGLGFYLDWNQRLRDNDTGEHGRGFIAPYVYIRISLVDLSTFGVVRQRAFTATETVGSFNDTGINPWQAMSAANKINAIERLLHRELQQALPELLAP